MLPDGVPRRVAVGLLVTVGAGVAVWLLVRPMESTTIRAPRPEVSEGAAEPLELPASSLPVPIRIDLATLVEEVERAVPTQWGDLSTPVERSDSGRATSAIRLDRTPFEASLNGSVARLATTVAYRVRGTYDLPLLPDVNYGCATEPDDVAPRLDVALVAPLRLTGDWRLDAQTEVLEVRPTTDEGRDRCEVTVVGLDITGRVTEAARGFLAEHTTAIDSIVGAADVRSSFEEWWNVLGQPIQLGDDIWLEIRPEAIRRGSVDGRGDVVEIPATLQARPRVVLGDRPAPSDRPLPHLQEGASEGRLQILVEAVAEYEDTGRLLTERLAGTELEIGGRRLRIEAIGLSGIGGGRVALEAAVGGSLDGRLFLVGTPAFDPETGYASVPDLAFAVSTSNLLVTGASWMLDGRLETLLRERARWPVEPLVAWAADRLHDGLNRSLAEGVRVEGTVHSVEVMGVRATIRALIVGAAASAEARLIVESGS